jgi:hypothetical protein
MSFNAHSLDEIKPVRGKSMHTRIQMKLIAVVLFRMLHYPVKQSAAETFRTVVTL